MLTIFIQILEKFAEALDSQSSQPAHFRNVSKNMWARFIDRQIDSVESRPYPSINFTVATGSFSKVYI